MEFGIENKKFKNDIDIIYNALVNREKFSFSKYADGEFSILVNKKITN